MVASSRRGLGRGRAGTGESWPSSSVACGGAVRSERTSRGGHRSRLGAARESTITRPSMEARGPRPSRGCGVPTAGRRSASRAACRDSRFRSIARQRLAQRQLLLRCLIEQVCRAGRGSSRSLPNGHADPLAQPAQGAVDRCRLGGMVRIQHAPDFALGNVEIAGETALRHTGLAERLVEGRLQRNRHRGTTRGRRLVARDGSGKPCR